MVVQTKRHRERTVEGLLVREGIPAYVPLLRQWPRPAVGGALGPMFPGYAFCQPTPRQLPLVGRTTGVTRFVTFGDGPAAVSAGVVEFLRSRAGADGIIDTQVPLAGREVTITDGPLRGLAAIVERRVSARQRVLVLLELLHRPTRVEVPDGWVRLV